MPKRRPLPRLASHPAGPEINPVGRKSGLAGLRLRLYLKSPRCHYCRKAILRFRDSTLDHKLPKSRGGKNRPWNLVLACRPCNVAKGSLTPREFAVTLEKDRVTKAKQLIKAHRQGAHVRRIPSLRKRLIPLTELVLETTDGRQNT